MKVIILAAGQGTRLRPLTDECPKCMVQVNGVSLIDRQIAVMKNCGIKEEEIYIVTGYCSNVLETKFAGSAIHIINNLNYETTNMVCSLMCAKEIMLSDKEVIVSYGDIIYDESVFRKILEGAQEISVIVDDEWYGYWKERCENPLDDAETLVFDNNDILLEIGQKTTDLNKIQAQYIGLMKFMESGIEKVTGLADIAKKKSERGQLLWRTERNYEKMYMTDLLQGLIDEGNILKAIHIKRGWFEIDDCADLKVVESKLKEAKNKNT